MKLTIDALYTSTDIPACMSIQDIQEATNQDDHLQQLKEYIIQRWQASSNKTSQEMILYWTFRDGQAVIHGILMKDRHVIIPEELQRQVLQQLHNHIGIKKKQQNYQCVNVFTGLIWMPILKIVSSIIPHVLISSRCSVRGRFYIMRYLANNGKSLKQTCFQCTVSSVFTL